MDVAGSATRLLWGGGDLLSAGQNIGTSNTHTNSMKDQYFIARNCRQSSHLRSTRLLEIVGNVVFGNAKLIDMVTAEPRRPGDMALGAICTTSYNTF